MQEIYKIQGDSTTCTALMIFSDWKTQEYEVMGVARHSETHEPLVVYRPLYNDSGWWVRPHAMFFGELEVDGKTVRRFVRIGD